MKRKTLQEQYNQIKKGKGSKEIFLKEAKKAFPNYIHNIATFNQAEKILRQKSIISENIWGVATGKTQQPDWFKIFNENVDAINEEVDYSKMHNVELNATYKEKFGVKDTKGLTRDELIKALKSGKAINESKELEKIISDTKVTGTIKDLEAEVKLKAKKAGLNVTDGEIEDAVSKHADEAMGLFEEVKAVEKKTSKEVTDLEEKNFDYKDKKDVNNVYGEAFLKGYYTEMKDPKNAEKTVNEVKEIVAKNLAKDQLHYVKEGQFGDKGVGYTDEHPGLKASKSDQMEKVKLKENLESHDSKKVKPKKKKVKKETIDTKLAEIDRASGMVALETKIEALAEIIESKMQRLSMVSEDENLSELVDKKKMKEMQKEIKLLEKRKAGFEKLYEKSCGMKYQQQEIVGEVTEEEEITESKRK